MGFGLPAAMGASLSGTSDPILLITGDGGFQMNLQELATIREHNLPVKILISNNGCLGMVRQWQEFFHEKRYSQTIFGYNPDFAKLAEVYGIPARRVTDPGELKNAIQDLLERPGPGLLDVVVEKEENVLPMIPAGGGQTDFFESNA
jgi:acetolactate synthase-1/2/3 large subunit